MRARAFNDADAARGNINTGRVSNHNAFRRNCGNRVAKTDSNCIKRDTDSVTNARANRIARTDSLAESGADRIA
jgi:hypothetical protein